MFLLEWLIEILSVVSVIGPIEQRWTVVESLVPLLVAWGKHAIICVFLDDKFGSGFGVSWVSSSESSVGFENISESLSSEGRFAIEGRDRWSELGVNYNVIGVGHLFLN